MVLGMVFLLYMGVFGVARKRGHGEGTVFERPDRPGTFRAVFTYKDPDTRKTKRKNFDDSSARKALRRGKEWLQGLEDGLLPDAGNVILRDWLRRWLDDYASMKVRRSTLAKYETSLMRYIAGSPLGNEALTELHGPDVQRLFNKLLKSGRRDGKGLSSDTVRNIRRYLSEALKQAVKDGLMRKNIIENTEPPKVKRLPVKVLTSEQITALTAETERIGGDESLIVLLALESGMRIGEIFGLKWDCVDFQGGAVHVKYSLITTKGGKRLEEPKTKMSKRRIPLRDEMMKVLAMHQKRQEWKMQELGDKFENNGFVFTNVFGRPCDHSNFTGRFFKGLLVAAGIETSFRFHDLRHTHASILLRQGVHPKVVQERLGHSTISITLDTYSHLLRDVQDEAVTALGRAFGTGAGEGEDGAGGQQNGQQNQIEKPKKAIKKNVRLLRNPVKSRNAI